MLGVAEVICKSGCGRAETGLATWIALGTAVAAVAALLAVCVGFLEARRLMRSIAVGQQGNAINSVSHCAQRYHEIMRDPHIRDQGARSGDVSPGSWWYRYWDLHTEQFTLFTKGLLDPVVYELWMTELATVYNESPYGVKTRAVTHAAYLDKTLPQHIALQSFFRQLSGISVDTDPASRAAQVQALIDAYTPKPLPRRQGVLYTLRGRPSPPDHQVLVSGQAIRRRVLELATVIDRRYGTKPLTVVAIMESAWRFAQDLAWLLNGPVELAKIDASSYKGGTEAKAVTVGNASRLNLKKRDVLIVDDIIETGKTLAAVRAEIERLSPRSTAICVLLSKPGRLERAEVKPNYIGFGSIPDNKFVVGYGIDFNNRFRDLSYISAVDERGRLLPTFDMTTPPPR
jgi:hypoxanthine phosphoribosyltransferase